MLLSILSLVCGEDSQLGVARKVKRTYPYEQHTRPERGRGDAEGTRSEPATQKFGEGLQDGSHTTLLSMKECEERFRRGELGEGVVKRGSETTLATLRTYCQNVMKAFQLRMDERAIQDEMNHVDFGTAEFDQRLKAIQPTGKMRTSLLAGGSQTGEAGLNGKYPPAEDGNATTPAVFTSLASLGVYGHKNGTFLLSMDMVSYNQRARIRRINARTGKVSTVDSGTAPSHAPVGTSLVIVKHKSARQVVYFSAALKTQDPVSLQATDLLSGSIHTIVEFDKQWISAVSGPLKERLPVVYSEGAGRIYATPEARHNTAITGKGTADVVAPVMAVFYDGIKPMLLWAAAAGNGVALLVVDLSVKNVKGVGKEVTMARRIRKEGWRDLPVFKPGSNHVMSRLALKFEGVDIMTALNHPYNPPLPMNPPFNPEKHHVKKIQMMRMLYGEVENDRSNVMYYDAKTYMNSAGVWKAVVLNTRGSTHADRVKQSQVAERNTTWYDRVNAGEFLVLELTLSDNETTGDDTGSVRGLVQYNMTDPSSEFNPDSWGLEFLHLAICPDNQLAYLLNVNGYVISLELQHPVTGEPFKHNQWGRIQQTGPVRLAQVTGIVMVTQTLLAFVDAMSVNLMDLSPTIKCQNYPFLVKSVSKFPVSQPGQTEVYKKYSNGTTLPLSAHVWSFVGYRKLSTKKTYDGGNFHFSKSMVCFRPCSRQGPCCGDGSCTLGALSGAAIPDKCCVDKVEEEGDPPPADAGVKAKLLELEKQAKRVPLESLGMLDGMKAF